MNHKKLKIQKILICFVQNNNHKINLIKKNYICSHFVPFEARTVAFGKVRGVDCPSKVALKSCFTGEKTPFQCLAPFISQQQQYNQQLKVGQTLIKVKKELNY